MRKHSEKELRKAFRKSRKEESTAYLERHSITIANLNLMALLYMKLGPVERDFDLRLENEEMTLQMQLQ